MNDTIPTTAPEAFNIEEHILDHAGAFYSWFDGAYVDEGNLYIRAASEAAEYLIDARNTDTETNRLRIFTRDQVWAVIVTVHNGWLPSHIDSYKARFYADLVNKNWDYLDGDMNIVDDLLQLLAFGEITFS